MSFIVMEWSWKSGRVSRWRPLGGYAPLLTRRICVLAGCATDVIAWWGMKAVMNHPQDGVIPVPRARQGMLELHGAGRWQEFPESDRDACLQALARLLYEIITRQAEGDENER
jgi:hypothetical protein